jgi:hypothetical protein
MAILSSPEVEQGVVVEPSNNDPLKTIDTTMLTPMVRRALNRATAEVLDWQSTELYGAGITTSVMRFTGSARDANSTLPWSLILKIIRPDESGDDPASLRYWKREALAYQSGLLDRLPGKVCAPRCYEVMERPGQEVWLWLEEVEDEEKGKWSLDHYGNVARHVGEFNGIFSENTTAFSHPWMTKQHLRSWVGPDAPILPPEVLAHPLISSFMPDEIYDWMQGVWAEHTTWLDFIERQPQTLAHHDVFRRNAFARRDHQGDWQTILIDWAFVGSATLGEEIAPLVAGSLNFLEFDSAQTHALDQTVFEGYLEGLRATGWRGDPRLVRFAYAVSSVLKFSVGVSGVAFMVADEHQQPILEQIFGHPVEELVEVWGNTLRFLRELAHEARELASQLK